MKQLSAAVLILMSLGCNLATAAPEADLPKIVNVTSTSKPLTLYSEPSTSAPSKTVSAAELTLPLTVLDKKNQFQQIQLPDGKYWVRSAHVVNTKTVDARADCTSKKTNSREASTPGIGEGTCK